jgi:hypothetical protein
MSALTSLLARDHAVPVRKIEEALSRQVMSGGDIATVLLEIDAIAENTLAAYQAALYGLLPATRDEVMRVPRDQVRLVPREVAEKHRLVPLAVDGRALLVAMAAPLDHDVESQLGFLLGYDLVVRIVCEVRITAALGHHYGIDPPARQKRLIEQLRHREAGVVPYVAPPEHGKLSLGQRTLVSKKVSASAWLDEPDEPEPPPPPPPARPSSLPPAPEGRTTDPMGVPRSQVEAAVLELESASASAQPSAEPDVVAAGVEATPVTPRASSAPRELVPASLSDVALSDVLSSPAPARLGQAAPPAVDAPVDGRATSPYGRAPMRPPTADRAIPSLGALADAPRSVARITSGWQSAPRDAEVAPDAPAEPAPTSRTDPEIPAVKQGDRLSVAPIVGVGVRRSSRPPGRPEPAPYERARPIVEPIVESELPPARPAIEPAAPIEKPSSGNAPRPLVTPAEPIEVPEPRASSITSPGFSTGASSPGFASPGFTSAASSPGFASPISSPGFTSAASSPGFSTGASSPGFSTGASSPGFTSAASSPGLSSSAGEVRADRRGPRLRGPLTAAQATKLLEDASDRDGIVAVFFAFARQFFDYAALFTLQDDRAEGRDAFGEGTTAARIRSLSLTIAGDEASLLASARKSGQPQLGRLETLADIDLATVLERPREIHAIAYPVVIRQRPVLVLYGDRSGDRFELSDVPELVGFVRRVADALEKLILRRKREGAKGRFEKPQGEEREDLKSAASAMRRSSPPAARPSGRARREDVWSTPKLGAVLPPLGEVSGPTLAEALAKAELPSGSSSSATPRAAPLAEPPSGVVAPPADVDGHDLASRALADAETAGEEAPRITLVDPLDAAAARGETAAVEATAEEAFRPTEELRRVPADERVSNEPVRRTVRNKQTMRDVLGIPRAAPPPPVVPDIFEPPSEVDPANEVMLGSTSDLTAEDAPAGPRTIPVPPPPENDDSPELVVGGSSDESSDPELVVGDDDGESEEPAPIELKRRAGPSYILRDAGVDVVEQVGGSRSQPPPRRRSVPPVAHEEIGPTPSRRHDPRREDDGPVAVEVVAKPQRGIGAMAKSAVIESKEVDGVKPTHDREVPSVIIDMGESTHALVEDLMHADPDGDTPSIDALLKIGEVALPALAQAFPGPLWFDRRRSYRKLPRGRDVSAVSRALVAFRERAAPYVGALVGAGSHDRRFYAVMVASEIPSGALVDPLVQRVFDEDAGVRALALEVLPKFRAFAEMQDQLVFLRRTARIRGKEPVRRLYALAALAAVRDAGALGNLVDLLEDEDEAVRRGSHGALVAITCEDLGESARRWAAWAEKNEGRHRIEWLMDALLSSEEPLRSQAGEELKAITQQYFGYHPAASRKEREVVQAKYRSWWDREGKALFR